MFVSEVMTADVLAFAPDVTAAAAFDAVQAVDNDYAGWRQQLYPVVMQEQYVGIVTRGDLFTAHDSDPEAAVKDLMRADPIVTHENQTLRVVAEQMAISEVGVLPVLYYATGTRVVGVVTLMQLLAGRRRDQHEARARERILSLRLVGR